MDYQLTDVDFGGLKTAETKINNDRRAYTITRFPIVEQMLELPTECEITTLTMLLKYYGFNIDKETVAYQYLLTVSADLYYGSDGLLYRPDMERNFVGNQGETGYVCGTTAILNAANNYFEQLGNDFYATVINQDSPQTLYHLLEQETPVLVCAALRLSLRFG